MEESSSSRPNLWFAVVAVLVAATVWAAVAMASGGSSAPSDTSSPTPSIPSYADPQPAFAADDGPHGHGNCPDEGDGGGGSTTPSTPSTPGTTPAPSTPSPQDGSSNPGL